MNYDHIRHDDPEIYESMMRELQRQRDHIELIARKTLSARPSWKPWAAI